MGNVPQAVDEAVSERSLHFVHYELVCCGVMLSLLSPENEVENEDEAEEEEGDDEEERERNSEKQRNKKENGGLRRL